MTYRCEDCGHEERIWNSRDGVTPFCMWCRQPGCTGTAQHVEWENDHYDPEHIPQHGEMLWIDMPESIKRPLARIRINRMQTDWPVSEAELPEIIESICEGFRAGEPWLIVWP
jgi:hypothetical protein